MMQNRTAAPTALLIAAALAAAQPLAAGAQGAPVTVSVNGAPVAFDQPPVERVGRVYVPLRGVFERLGASVVYEGGKIAATRGTTTVALQIGSNAAVVNGAQTVLDAPPFLIGARTLVPLRFVAQALGASVNYDGSSRTVAITQTVAAAAPPPVRVTPPPPPPVRLVRVEPAPNETIASLRPQIAATFPRDVNPNGVHVRLDGRDVTAESYISPRAVVYDPGFDLPFGRHSVTVAAPDVSDTWAFTNVPQASPNVLRDVLPPNGSRVGTAFTVQGYTKPFSQVHIVAVANLTLGFGNVNESTVTADSEADPNGHFARQIRILDAGAGVVDVRLVSRAPDGGVATRTLRLRP